MGSCSTKEREESRGEEKREEVGREDCTRYLPINQL